MELGFIGLGRMGLGMVAKLIGKGHRVAAFDLDPGRTAEAAASGADICLDLSDVPTRLAPPRLIWLMVPAGSPVDAVIEGLLPHLERDDILIDGGNSFYKDSQRRAARLASRGIQYLDVGSSGGIYGAAEGLCLMVGGEEAPFERARPVLEALAMPGGLGHFGLSGAGHYVKMVHNGIEYSLLQAYGEGFELLKEAPFPIDLNQVACVWNRGSVVRSWLLELAARALDRDPSLASIAGHVGGGESGRWALETAMERGVPFAMTGLALSLRLRSRQEESFAGKLVAALRWEFGGHETKPARE